MLPHLPALLCALLACQAGSGTLAVTGDDSVTAVDSEDTEDSAEAHRTLRFADVGFPETEEDRRAVRASQAVAIDGVTEAIDYQILLRSGASPDGVGVFGRLIDATGAPLYSADGQDVVSAAVDFSSLQQTASGALVSITHIEANPGALYRTAITQDAGTGLLTATSTTPLDLSALGGLYLPCAASITPWGTHLGGEEYPPDARKWAQAQTWTDLELSIRGHVRYWGHDTLTDEDEDNVPDNIVLADLQRDFLPYRYGHTFEITATDSETTVVRHTSMGRTSMELALVMPDQRTAYITDDETNAGLYLYVADTAGDLSAGTLYAMHWTQTSDEGAGEADLDWISLGHATDAAIDTLIADGIVFGDLFEVRESEVDGDGLATWTCEDGFTGVNTWAGFECLSLVAGMEVAASRLETDRYAALVGATTELRKGEGITHDPERGRLYFAISNIARGMESGAAGGYDQGGPDDIRLAPNDCGAVYALDLAASDTMDSDYVAQRASALLVGTPLPTALETVFAGNDCRVGEIANPDNLHYLPAFGVLIIAEDTRAQANDSVWAYDVRTGTLDRIFTAPYGAENTSVYDFSTAAGWTYLKIVVHAPFGERSLPGPETLDETAAYDGVLGPLPRWSE